MNNGADFLQIASHLSAAPVSLPQEASFRSSYGRSYYAALNVACAALSSAGYAIDRGSGKHGQIVGLLKGSKNATVQSCGTRLGQMRDRRNTCDYEMGAAISGTDAAKGYQMARSIIQDLEAALAISARLYIPK